MNQEDNNTSPKSQEPNNSQSVENKPVNFEDSIWKNATHIILHPADRGPFTVSEQLDLLIPKEKRAAFKESFTKYLKEIEERADKKSNSDKRMRNIFSHNS